MSSASGHNVFEQNGLEQMGKLYVLQMLNNSRDQDQTKVLEQFKADSNYLENYISIYRLYLMYTLL